MRGRAVTAQVFLAFFLPLSLALIHTAVGMTAANAVIAQVGRLGADWYAVFPFRPGGCPRLSGGTPG